MKTATKSEIDNDMTTLGSTTDIDISDKKLENMIIAKINYSPALSSLLTPKNYVVLILL